MPRLRSGSSSWCLRVVEMSLTDASRSQNKPMLAFLSTSFLGLPLPPSHPLFTCYSYPSPSSLFLLRIRYFSSFLSVLSQNPPLSIMKELEKKKENHPPLSPLFTCFSHYPPLSPSPSSLFLVAFSFFLDLFLSFMNRNKENLPPSHSTPLPSLI